MSVTFSLERPAQEERKKKKPKPVVLRAENLVVRFCKAYGKHGKMNLQACGACRLAHYCGAGCQKAGCQKAGWRKHKAFCKFTQNNCTAEAAAAATATAALSSVKAAKVAAAAASGSGGAGVGSGRGEGLTRS